jgi:hypothetical protein
MSCLEMFSFRSICVKFRLTSPGKRNKTPIFAAEMSHYVTFSKCKTNYLRRMKKLFYVLPIASVMFLTACGEGDSSSDALDGEMTESGDFDAAVASFSEGGATDGEEYFSGVLAEVVEVDVKFREIKELDEIDATEEEITGVLDDAVQMIKDARAAMDLYTDKDWPKRAELHDLTLEWFSTVEALMNDYLYDLAEPMSRPDDTWTDEEIAFYEEYTVAYEGFYEVDSEWVEFQHEYAAANGFVLSGTIDEDALVEEEVSSDAH